jgi:hypothetical protein
VLLVIQLPINPPLVWPEPRILASQAGYVTHPPFEAAVSAADLVAGVLVGVADKTIQWLQALVALPRAKPSAPTARKLRRTILHPRREKLRFNLR